MFKELFYFTLALGFVPILIHLFCKKEGGTKQLLILPFLWLVALGSIYEFFQATFLNYGYEVWYKVYALSETFCLVYYFYLLLNKKYKIFFAFCSSAFVVLFISLLLNWTPDFDELIDAYLQVAETLFIFSCVFLWLKRLFTDLADISLLKIPDFYYVSGIILYLAGILFMFLMRDLMDQNPSINWLNYWNIIIYFNIALRLLLIVGVWKAQSKSYQYSA